MIALTCYGGVGEIGGNKLLLEDGESRLFFDFGTSYGQRYRYFEEYLKPRTGAGLLDYLEMGLLPPLRGLYREDLIPIDQSGLQGETAFWQAFSGSPAYRDLQGLEIHGVLLSHAHLDHSGAISFLRGDIPIYTTLTTAFTAKAIQDTGRSSDLDGEICYFSRRSLEGDYLSPERGPGYQGRPFVIVGGQAPSPEAALFWRQSPSTKALHLDRAQLPANQIGRLPLRSFPLDHSVLGASGYAVETSQGWVAYSGDLRLHGARGQRSRDFAAGLAELRPLAFLCEGTRAGEGPGVTEEEAFRSCLAAAREAKGMVVADFGARNVERLFSFATIAAETKRRLVITPRDAYLLEALYLAEPELPGLWGDVLIYQERRGKRDKWEKGLWERHKGRAIRAEDMRGDLGRFILCFSFWDVNELIDLAPRGGAYIYSSTEAHNEEQVLDLRRLENWVGHFGLALRGHPERERGFHASGHASGEELLALIRQVRPRYLVPIHTEHPEYFAAGLAGTGIEVMPPEYGRRLAFGG